jgi:elongation factor 1-alpha
MITGTSQADAAILVCSAKEGEFEAGISDVGQTREHAYLAKTLGVNRLVVAINKMDDASVDFSESRYNEVRDELETLLKKVGYKITTGDVTFLPLSGYTGENLVKASPKMTWYKGPSLIDAIDSLPVPEKPTDKPLRIPIQDVYKIRGASVVPVGRVETGMCNVGSKVIVAPGGYKSEIKSIEMHHEAMNSAAPGDNIGFSIRGASITDLHRGDVVGDQANPPAVVNPSGHMLVQMIIIYHPSAIAQGYTPVVHSHTAQIACRFMELVKKLDPTTGQVIEENPQVIKMNDAALVKLAPIKKFPIEKFKEYPQIGRVAVRDMGKTVAVGVVLDIIN